MEEFVDALTTDALAARVFHSNAAFKLLRFWTGANRGIRKRLARAPRADRKIQCGLRMVVG